jgi:hypothetical protein
MYKYASAVARFSKTGNVDVDAMIMIYQTQRLIFKTRGEAEFQEAFPRAGQEENCLDAHLRVYCVNFVRWNTQVSAFHFLFRSSRQKDPSLRLTANRPSGSVVALRYLGLCNSVGYPNRSPR